MQITSPFSQRDKKGTGFGSFYWRCVTEDLSTWVFSAVLLKPYLLLSAVFSFFFLFLWLSDWNYFHCSKRNSGGEGQVGGVRDFPVDIDISSHVGQLARVRTHCCRKWVFPCSWKLYFQHTFSYPCVTVLCWRAGCGVGLPGKFARLLASRRKHLWLSWPDSWQSHLECKMPKLIVPLV